MLCFGTVALAEDFVGSAKSAIYHYRDCEWAVKINPENQVVFKSVEDALNRGYRSCHVCFPPEAGKIERIWLDNPGLTLNVGEFAELKWCYSPENAQDAKDIKVTSSNPGVAVITDGKLYAKSLGSVEICASTPGKVSCKYTFNVVPVPVKSVSFNEKSITVKSGDVFSPEVKVEPINTDYKIVTWKTSDKKVVKVTDDGKLKAVGAGKCKVTAICGGVEESIDVVVEKSYTFIAIIAAVILGAAVALGFIIKSKTKKN